MKAAPVSAAGGSKVIPLQVLPHQACLKCHIAVAPFEERVGAFHKSCYEEIYMAEHGRRPILRLTGIAKLFQLAERQQAALA